MLLIGIVAESIYYEKYKIEHIEKSDKVKEVVENMLKKQDDKALTSEGKIKSYKIDFDKLGENLMGRIYILLIINDDPEIKLDTTLEKGTRGEKYKTGAKGISPKLDKLVYGEKQ